jgi:hypothetical protein
MGRLLPAVLAALACALSILAGQVHGSAHEYLATGVAASAAGLAAYASAPSKKNLHDVGVGEFGCL